MKNTFTLFHWGLALLLAAGLHMSLLLNYHTEDTFLPAQSTTHEIVIGLKKLTTPAPPVVEIPDVVKSEPIVKPKAIPKPKPKKKPQIVTPKISEPVVAPVVSSPKITSKPVVPQRQPRTDKPKAHSSPDSNALNKQKTAYFTQLARWLERHKQYPSVARRRNQQGEVVIQFKINEQGELLHHSIVKPSRHESLNNATRSMLERAAPLPPVPPTLRQGQSQFTYTIPVRFKLEK